MTVNRTEARRLYKLALEHFATLNFQLFMLSEAAELNIDEAAQRRKMTMALQSATDTIKALARVSVIAQDLVDQVNEAVKEAMNEPTAVVSIPVADPECPEEEAYSHVLALQELAARLAAIYGLDIEEQSQGLTTPQIQLRRICENIGESIIYLIQKNIIENPKSEHHVKHLLFASVRAAFPDALPDGKVAFPSPLGEHVPDLSVPIIKACIETKVARSQAALSAVVEGLLGDISTYGSSAYTTFFAVIYTNDDMLTQTLLNEVLEKRKKLSGINPQYHWKWLLVRGPLASVQSKS